MKCTTAPKSHVSDWNFIFILMQIYRLSCENVETNWINSASKQIQNVGKTFPGSNNMSSIQITVLIEILLFIALWLMPTSLWNKKMTENWDVTYFTAIKICCLFIRYNNYIYCKTSTATETANAYESFFETPKSNYNYLVDINLHEADFHVDIYRKSHRTPFFTLN